MKKNKGNIALMVPKSKFGSGFRFLVLFFAYCISIYLLNYLDKNFGNIKFFDIEIMAPLVALLKLKDFEISLGSWLYFAVFSVAFIGLILQLSFSPIISNKVKQSYVGYSGNIAQANSQIKKTIFGKGFVFTTSYLALSALLFACAKFVIIPFIEKSDTLYLYVKERFNVTLTEIITTIGFFLIIFLLVLFVTFIAIVVVLLIVKTLAVVVKSAEQKSAVEVESTVEMVGNFGDRLVASQEEIMKSQEKMIITLLEGMKENSLGQTVAGTIAEEELDNKEELTEDSDSDDDIDDLDSDLEESDDSDDIDIDNILGDDNNTYFPSLIEIDEMHNSGLAEIVSRTTEKIGLEDLIYRFHSYLCNKRKIYFEVDIVRSFICGLGCARLIILEGLSGTGKTTLPRMLSDFLSTTTNICAVQSTWRDRTDVIGYYNDFANKYKETKFLKALYEAAHTIEIPQIIVIDEMNLSRVEYYFADFLSVLEYPEDQWMIELMPHIDCKDIPEKIENNSVRIQKNTWVIGTGNKDDSTFAITDKVYDRAFVIDFDARNREITSTYNSNPLPLSTTALYQMYEDAIQNDAYRMNAEDRRKFAIICDFTADNLEVVFGNRIMNQIEKFVPIFVAAGGLKEKALDIIFARKVIRKLEGKFDDYIKDGLVKLSNIITKTYGKHIFNDTENAINKLRKKLM